MHKTDAISDCMNMKGRTSHTESSMSTHSWSHSVWKGHALLLMHKTDGISHCMNMKGRTSHTESSMSTHSWSNSAENGYALLLMHKTDGISDCMNMKGRTSHTESSMSTHSWSHSVWKGHAPPTAHAHSASSASAVSKESSAEVARVVPWLAAPPAAPAIGRVGQNHIFLRIYGVHAVILARILPHIQFWPTLVIGIGGHC